MGEIFHSVVNRLSGTLVVAALGLGSVAAAQTTELPPETFLKENIASPVLHWFGKSGSWEGDHKHGKPLEVMGGHIDLSSYSLSLTTYVEAKAGVDSSILGIHYDDSDAVEKGLVENELLVPGITAADLRSTSEVTYITMFTKAADGTIRDTGIDLTSARFVMQHPEVGKNVNGKYECEHSPEDKDYTGCITSLSTDDGVLSELPIIGDSDNAIKLPNSARKLMDIYGTIDLCDFDAILIPAINGVYAELNKTQGFNIPLIDGPTRYQQTLAIMDRANVRKAMSDSREPQSIRVNVTGAYQPPAGINERIQAVRDNNPGFPFIAPKNLDVDHCAATLNGQVPMALSGFDLGKFPEEIKDIAIMGLPQVPDGYDPAAKAFVQGNKFKAPPESAFADVGAA